MIYWTHFAIKSLWTVKWLWLVTTDGTSSPKENTCWINHIGHFHFSVNCCLFSMFRFTFSIGTVASSYRRRLEPYLFGQNLYEIWCENKMSGQNRWIYLGHGSQTHVQCISTYLNILLHQFFLNETIATKLNQFDGFFCCYCCHRRSLSCRGDERCTMGSTILRN